MPQTKSVRALLWRTWPFCFLRSTALCDCSLFIFLFFSCYLSLLVQESSRREAAGGLHLSGLLIMPIQHIPRLKLLVEVIPRALSFSHLVLLRVLFVCFLLHSNCWKRRTNRISIITRCTRQWYNCTQRRQCSKRAFAIARTATRWLSWTASSPG